MLNGVLEGEDTSLGLGFISNIGILLSHTNHHTLVTGTEGYLSWTGPHLQHRHPSVPYQPSHPGDGDGQQWRGRQLWEHHLQQIQPCTCRSHCQRQEQQRLRHTSFSFFFLTLKQQVL